MNTIVLHGSLAEEFGKTFKMDVATPREAFIALCSQLKGFEQRVRDGAFRVVRRKKKDVTYIDERTLDLHGDGIKIEIYPAMVGGKGGLGKVLLGVAIIGLAIVAAPAALGAIGAGGASFGAAMTAGIGFMGITYGGIAAFGAMIAFGGLAMMFAPSPKAQGAKLAKDDSSYILSGPTNSMYQGIAVPLVYGLFLTGSVVVSSGVTIEQMVAPATSSGSKIGSLLGAITGSMTGDYDASDAWTEEGYPNYPDATESVGGSGSGGRLILNDVKLV